MTKEESKERKKVARFYKKGLMLSCGCVLTGLFAGLGFNVDADIIKQEALNEFKKTEAYIQQVIDFEEENQIKLSEGVLSSQQAQQASKDFNSEGNTILLIKNSQDEVAKEAVLKSEKYNAVGKASYYSIIASGYLATGLLMLTFMAGADDIEENDKEVDDWNQMMREQKECNI